MRANSRSRLDHRSILLQKQTGQCAQGLCDPAACTTRTSAYGTDTPWTLFSLSFTWSILLDLPGISFRCLCAAIEGNVTKAFATSTHWSGNRPKGTDCKWPVLPFRKNNILEVCDNKKCEQSQASIQKTPGIAWIRQELYRCQFLFFSACMVVGYCRKEKWETHEAKWKWLCLCTWLAIILPLKTKLAFDIKPN